MKKRIMMLTVVLALTAGTVAGCGSTQEAETATGVVKEEIPAQEVAADTSKEAEQNTQIANPWVTITEDEAKAACIRLFKVPEGAQVKGWSKNESLADPDTYLGPMIQLDFTMDGMDFTARAQQGADPDADIAGCYYEWTVGPEDVTLANWGEGHMTGKTYRYVGESEFVDLITWYDIEIGISYSLSVSAKDLEGFDIQAVAEQMYEPANEPQIP